MKLSAETMTLRDRLGGDEGAVQILAEAGFDCIDYSMDNMKRDDCIWNTDDYREYAKKLNKLAANLGIHYNQAHAPFEFDWNSQEEVRDKAVPRIIKSLEVASLLGIENIIIHPIHHLVYKDNKEFLRKENLRYYASFEPYAKKYGVKIALENMFQVDEKRGCTVYDVFADFKEFTGTYDTLNKEYYVCCVDVGHVVLSGEEPADMIRALGRERLKALHIHDNDFHADSHTLPYFGRIDWDSTLKALAEINYDGVFTFEIVNFYRNFETPFLPKAVKFAHDTGRYMINKIESYKA